ncbi:MAG: hypothetical protein ABSA47_04865 [Verrucomicrobiota bacterium]|jgi:type III restriction enzyme
MKQVVIENPVINSPFDEPRRRFRFSDEGITNEIVSEPRTSSYVTRADRCHISHVEADTDSWEQKLAQTLEDMPEFFAYVKNQKLGFTIPYTLNGEEHNYYPDFMVRIDDGHGPDDLLNLIVESTVEQKKDKQAKVSTAKTPWIPAVNNHGQFGRWSFLENRDPWDAQNATRNALTKKKV